MNNKTIQCDEKAGKGQGVFDFSKIKQQLATRQLEFLLRTKFHYIVKARSSNEIEFLLWDSEFYYGYALIVNTDAISESAIYKGMGTGETLCKHAGEINGRIAKEMIPKFLFAFKEYSQNSQPDELLQEATKLLEFLVEYQGWKNRLRMFFSDAYIRITDASLLLGRLS